MDHSDETAAPEGARDDDAPPGPAPARLVEAAKGFGEHGFAVLDGGHFDDLPAKLRAAGLFGRSLFLDHADVEVERAGPWLVALGQRDEATDRVFAILGDRPAAVIWSCEAGEAALFHQLRTINQARIPAWAAQGGSGPTESEEASHTRAYEAVMFRHWDPRVLGALLPALDAGQFCRILGPASSLVLHAEDFGGLKRVVADPNWPPAPAGLLTIRSEQIALLMDRRAQAADRAMIRYLRAVAPEDTAGLSDAALHEKIVGYRASAERAGLIEESTIAQWAYMMISTGDQFDKQPRLRTYLARGPSTPDRNLDQIVSEMLLLARAEERERR